MANETVIVISVAVSLILLLLVLIVACVWIYVCWGQDSRDIQQEEIDEMKKTSQQRYRAKYSRSSEESGERSLRRPGRWSQGDRLSYSEKGIPLSPIQLQPAVRGNGKSESDLTFTQISRSVNDVLASSAADSTAHYQLSVTESDLDLNEGLFEKPVNSDNIDGDSSKTEELAVTAEQLEPMQSLDDKSTGSDAILESNSDSSSTATADKIEQTLDSLVFLQQESSTSDDEAENDVAHSTETRDTNRNGTLEQHQQIESIPLQSDSNESKRVLSKEESVEELINPLIIDYPPRPASAEIQVTQTLVNEQVTPPVLAREDSSGVQVRLELSSSTGEKRLSPVPRRRKSGRNEDITEVHANLGEMSPSLKVSLLKEHFQSVADNSPESSPRTRRRQVDLSSSSGSEASLGSGQGGSQTNMEAIAEEEEEMAQEVTQEKVQEEDDVFTENDTSVPVIKVTQEDSTYREQAITVVSNIKKRLIQTSPLAVTSYKAESLNKNNGYDEERTRSLRSLSGSDFDDDSGSDSEMIEPLKAAQETTSKAPGSPRSPPKRKVTPGPNEMLGPSRYRPPLKKQNPLTMIEEDNDEEQ